MTGDCHVRFCKRRGVRLPPATDQISGTFQSIDGAYRFVAVRSYLQTADAHGHNLLDACRDLFTTGAWIPPPAAIT